MLIILAKILGLIKPKIQQGVMCAKLYRGTKTRGHYAKLKFKPNIIVMYREREQIQ
jgi:hypothetical protein